MSHESAAGAPPAEAVAGTGVCNTRPGLTSGTSGFASGTTGERETPGVLEAGIDTVRFLFRLHDDRQKRWAEERLRRPADLAGAMKFGYMPGHDLIWAQGRPATVLWCDRDHERRLLPAAALPDACELVGMALDEHGYSDARPVGISRLDSTVTIRFRRPAEGFALLRGLAVLDVPRRKPAIYGRPPETVYWLTERGHVRERAYDKGLEAATARPGFVMRLEGQRPVPARERTTAAWWTMERVHEQFGKHFRPMAQAGGELHVASPEVLDRQLADFARAGRITPRMARVLMAHLAGERVGLREPKSTRLRHRAQLRKLGLAQALDGDESDVDLDLGAVLDDALTSPHWRA